MKNRIVYLHGNNATHWAFAWASWLKQELEKRGYKTFFETMPDSIIARSEYWIPFLENHVRVGENDIIVGWSTGSIAAMRYAETHKIKGSILVGTYHTDLGDSMEKQSGYFNKPWDWKAIKANQNWIAQFQSINDPIVPVTEGRFVRDQLSTEYFEFDDKFHFGWPEPMDNFPELLEFLLKHSE